MKFSTVYFFLLILIAAAAPDNAGNLCEVHGVPMSYRELPYKVTGELTREQVEETEIRDRVFPHGREFTPTGCLPSGELGLSRTPMGFVCPECVRARLAWLAQFAAAE